MTDLKILGNMLQQINSLLDKKQKRALIGVMALTFVNALFETLGISVILPFMQVLLMPDALMSNRHVQYIMNAMGLHTVVQMTGLLVVAVIGIYVIKNVIIAWATYVKLQYSKGINRDIAVTLMESYMKRPYEFFTTHTTGEISRGVGGDANSVFAVISCLLNIITNILTAVCIGVILFSTDMMLAISVIIIAGLSILLTVFFFRKKMAVLGRERREADRALSEVTIQIVHGIKEIFMKQKKDLFLGRFREGKEIQRRTSVESAFLNTLPVRFIEIVGVSGIMIAILIRMAMGIDMQLFISNLAVFALAAFKIMPCVSTISAELTNLIYYRPGLEAAYRDIMAVRNYQHVLDESQQCQVENTRRTFRDKIEFKNVVWKYENGEKPVLLGLNAVIHKGEVIGIVGESGAGKSTFSDILLGLYKPQEGTVQMDGMDIFQQAGTWSTMIGYVPQSTYLFDDSIRNNVAFGDEYPDDGRVWEVLEKASLKDFVESLPDGVNTRVGERGVMLSGGQRQRVAIARALYSLPQVMVLDEATSALDNETEAAVMEAIESLQGSITMVIIAHRLTTLKKCDRIYRIENGVADEIDKAALFEENN